ncbi:MAG: hypothetical protein Q7W45_07990 [Bacteroidota bacterium]|nr:hypothetical protein [Bacteroidota bacterium]MDP3145965.1 hypothetical protein [Bacteroidota bacterium]
MKNILAVVIGFVFVVGYAQNDSILVSSTNFFKDGLYPTYFDFRHNTPIPASDVTAKIHGSTKGVYLKIRNNSKVVYLKNGKKIKAKVSALWGFVEDEKLYFNRKGKFYPVDYLGAISVFTISVTNTSLISGNQNFQDFHTGGNGVIAEDVLTPCVFSYYNGKIYFALRNKLSDLFKPEPEIYNEFEKMTPESQRALLLQYTNRFNKLHPMYILK